MRKLTALALLLAAAAACHATTYLVNPDGSGDFPTIQAALDAVVTGDVIELGDGLFTGPGNRDLVPGWMNLTIRSQSGDAGACMIDCQGSAGDPAFSKGAN